MAKDHPNLYQIAIFPCCRELWSSARNWGGIGNVSHDEANMHFRYIKDSDSTYEREIKEA